MKAVLPLDALIAVRVSARQPAGTTNLVGEENLVFRSGPGPKSEGSESVTCGQLSVTPDGRLRAVASMDPFIHVIDLDQAVETTAFRGHAAGVARVAFHPSGQRLYSLDTKGAVRAWPVADPLNRAAHDQSR